ncbi:PQQ-binding-like beta-propeller repeat protein [Candidatus Microgenomates bacterium]|nr:PQQ-binding-like beta-propeller repeat protein [Candidatus Microgenomates bacterium]
MSRQELDQENYQPPEEPTRRDFLRMLATIPIAPSTAAAFLAACRPNTGSPSSQADFPPPYEIPAHIREQLPERGKTSILWQTNIESFKDPFSNSIAASPLLVTEDSILLTRSSDKRFVKLDLKSGNISWPEPWDNAGTPIATVDNKIWILREGKKRIYPLSISDGKQASERLDIPEEFNLSLPILVKENRIYLLLSRSLQSGGTSSLVSQIGFIDGESGKYTSLVNHQERNVTYVLLPRVKDISSKVIVITSPTPGGDVPYMIINTKDGSMMDMKGKLDLPFMPGFATQVFYLGLADENKIVLLFTNVTFQNRALATAVVAIDELRNLVWTLPEPIKAPILKFADNLLLASSQRGDALVAIEGSSGKVSINDEIEPEKALAVDQNFVYILTKNAVLSLFRASIGSRPSWRSDFPQQQKATAPRGIIFGEELVISDSQKLTFIHKETGKPTRSPLPINFEAKNLQASGDYLVVEGENKVVVIQ